MTNKPIAHVKPNKNKKGEWGIHFLEEHLNEVKRIAAGMAECFGSSDWAGLAGLWHDLGKYKRAFQEYIGKSSGYHADAHIEMPGKKEREHSTAGAIHAIMREPALGRILAYLIAGHHAGLPDWLKDEVSGRGLDDRLKEEIHLCDAKKGNIPQYILDAPLPVNLPPANGEHAHLWIRMLFSCLVDADFLDTEKFMNPEQADLRIFYDAEEKINELNDRLHAWMDERDNELQRKGTFDSEVNIIRREILQDAMDSVKKAPGFFSLNVPTGGGKTISSIAFALGHALQYQKRRVIMVIPFTSIIEQTAKQYREIFGEKNILEHHSNFDIDRETPQSRLAAENWESPIVVTTNVQFFESLFASRTSRCRKLHNIVNSVIILDEAQMLPPEKLMPTLSVLKGLVEHFGCSVVLCTATQPALTGHFNNGTEGKWEGLVYRNIQNSKGIVEIVHNPQELSKKLKRVEVQLHEKTSIEWLDLAQELSAFQQVLCIVNRRQDCRELYEALNAENTNAVHLSALMCGAHRTDVIAEIKSKLCAHLPLRVVSTQLVEAGVDIDFPVVYRAMAGLDRIAQAAGRCNREGLLNLKGSLGKVVIFHPPKPSPPGLLRKGEDTAEEILYGMKGNSLELKPELFDRYFRQFFGKVNTHGKSDFYHYLVTNAASIQFQFKSAEKWYRLINEDGYKPVVVWYEKEVDHKTVSCKKIMSEIEFLGLSRQRLRQLSRYTVNVPERVLHNLVAQGAVRQMETPEGPCDLWVQAVDGLYDAVFGLKLEGPQYQAIDFIC